MFCQLLLQKQKSEEEKKTTCRKAVLNCPSETHPSLKNYYENTELQEPIWGWGASRHCKENHEAFKSS